LKILQLTKKFPYPIKDGEVIGIINLTIGFHAHGHEVQVLALNTNKHYFDVAKLPEHIAAIASFRAVDISTDVRPLDAFANLFSSKSYNVERFYSKEYEDLLYQTLTKEQFDFILLEGVYMMRYIDIIRKAQKDSAVNKTTPVVQRPQNVEYVIWQRLADKESNPLKKWYLSFLAKRMKRFELEMINKADVLIPVSQTDLDIFKKHGCNIKSVAIPTGYVFDTLPQINQAIESNSVAFIGGMDWMPNRDGVEWFINKVWPLVLLEISDAQFFLAGRNFPDEIRNLKVRGLHIVGEVDDAKIFVQQHAVAIVPLFAGSGMRVKIVEAMAWGRAIVSTSIGAESLAYTQGKDILIADDERTFSKAIISVLKSNAERIKLGENAQDLIREKYDNRKISAAIVDFIKQKN
jgi:glycosyltransferase involved in cell wall biosynthesis